MKDKQGKVIKINVPDDVNGFKIKVYLSRIHIISAALFARQCYKIETDTTNAIGSDSRRAPQNTVEENQSYVLGSIFSSVSFLESLINEIYSDTIDEDSKFRIFGLEEKAIQKLAEIWSLLGDKKSISMLEKYQLALISMDGKQLEKGAQTYQDICLLIRLRNRLVHFKPNWYEMKKDNKYIPHDLEKYFKSRDVPECQIVSKKQPYFPYRLLGYGFSKWAVVSSLKFSDEFFERIGIAPFYDDIRNRLEIP